MPSTGVNSGDSSVADIAQRQLQQATPQSQTNKDLSNARQIGSSSGVGKVVAEHLPGAVGANPAAAADLPRLTFVQASEKAATLKPGDHFFYISLDQRNTVCVCMKGREGQIAYTSFGLLEENGVLQLIEHNGKRHTLTAFINGYKGEGNFPAPNEAEVAFKRVPVLSEEQVKQLLVGKDPRAITFSKTADRRGLLLYYHEKRWGNLILAVMSFNPIEGKPGFFKRDGDDKEYTVPSIVTNFVQMIQNQDPKKGVLPLRSILTANPEVAFRRVPVISEAEAQRLVSGKAAGAYTLRKSSDGKALRLYYATMVNGRTQLALMSFNPIPGKPGFFKRDGDDKEYTVPLIIEHAKEILGNEEAVQVRPQRNTGIVFQDIGQAQEKQVPEKSLEEHLESVEPGLTDREKRNTEVRSAFLKALQAFSDEEFEIKVPHAWSHVTLSFTITSRTENKTIEVEASLYRYMHKAENRDERGIMLTWGENAKQRYIPHEENGGPDFTAYLRDTCNKIFWDE